MNKLRILLLNLAVTFACALAVAQVNLKPKSELVPPANSENKLFYRVKKDDWASKVLRQFEFKPLYAKNGAVNTIIKENPHCQASNCNMIRTGSLLYFSPTQYEQLKKVATILPTGEVIFNPSTATTPPTASAAAPLTQEERPLDKVDVAIAAAPELPFDKYSEHRVIAALRFIGIKGTDLAALTNLEAKAELAPSVNILSRFHHKRSWGLMTEFEVLHLNFKQVPTNDLYDLEHTTGYGFLGADYYADKWRFGFSGGLAEYLLYSATSTADVNIDQSWAPTARFDAEYKYNFSKVTSQFYAGYEVIFSHNVRGVKSDIGSGYHAGAALKYPLRNFNIDGVIEYRHHEFNIALAEHEYFEVYGGLGISWRK